MESANALCDNRQEKSAVASIALFGATTEIALSTIYRNILRFAFIA